MPYSDSHLEHELLNSLCEHLPVPFVRILQTTDRGLKLLFCNKSIEELSGLSNDELIEKEEYFWRIFGPKGKGQIEKLMAVAVLDTNKWEHKFLAKLSSGKSRWLKALGKSGKDKNGNLFWNVVLFEIDHCNKGKEPIHSAESQHPKNNTYQNIPRKLLDRVYNLTKIGGWEFDVAKNNFFCSPMANKILETEQERHIDMNTFIGFFRPDIQVSVRVYLEEGIVKGIPWDFELPIITSKGYEKWVRCIGQSDFKNGTCCRLFGSIQDIHQGKITELRLQKTADNIPGVIFQYILQSDGSDEITHLTKGAYKLWGHSPEACMEDIQLIWDQTKGGGDFEKVKASIKQSAETMEPWHCQYRSRLPDGRILWHEGYGAPQRLRDGSILWDSLIIDITEKKELENLLERASQLAKIGSWEMDLRKGPNENIYWSPITKMILEVDPDYNPAITSGYELYETDSKTLISNATKRLIEKGEEFDLELLLSTASGNKKWIRCIGQSERSDGKCMKIYGSVQDIHWRKTTELELKKLNKNLRKHVKELAVSNSELEQFAYVASHDLQEPLRMVTGFLSQLEKKYKGQLDDKARQYIDIAVDGANRMRKIILDLLEFSRLGKVEEELSEVSLSDVIEEALKLQSKNIVETNARVQIGPMPTLMGFRSPLIQVFQNLVGNSLKYRKEDLTPVISISAEELSAEWMFTVQDNGIGIDPQFFQKIFVIFQRLHTKEKYSGTGIGLAIVKKIIDNLGGKIWVESEPGNWSKFIFTIPKKIETTN
ncbi:ATP-binding protein [Aquiflexum sp.]|uniref:PAS domain-containing sensor histidine kinase n=1 Tax=Aquiflexum sp. TaxID=1872584 RepID=UPI00359486B4